MRRGVTKAPRALTSWPMPMWGPSFASHLPCILNRTPAYTGRNHCHALKRDSAVLFVKWSWGRGPTRKIWTMVSALQENKTSTTPRWCRQRQTTLFQDDDQLNKAVVTSHRGQTEGNFQMFSRDCVRTIRANCMQVLYYECQTAPASHKWAVSSLVRVPTEKRLSPFSE